MQKRYYFITNRRIEGADDSWAWEDLLAEDGREYEELKKAGEARCP